MARLIVLLASVLLILSLIPLAGAVGISGPYKPSYLFEPGMELNLSYVAINSADQDLNISLAIDADPNYCCASAVAEDAGIIENTSIITPRSVMLRPGGQAPFNIYLKFPAEMKVAGQHAFLIRATESPAPGAGISARASVRTPIFLFVRFPGRYVDVALQAPDVETEKLETFFVRVANRGTLDVSKAYAAVTVFDAKNKSIAKVYTNTKSIPRDGTFVLEATWNTTGQSEGLYNAVANVDYDGFTKQSSDDFRIGVLNLLVRNYTTTMITGMINPFEIQVESRWNDVIKNVYASVDIKKENELIATFQTPTTEIPPWTTKNVSGFFDANIPPGIYDADINLHFAEKSITIVDKLIVIEKSLLMGGFLITILVFVGLLVVNLLLWLFMWRKRKSPPPNQQG